MGQTEYYREYRRKKEGKPDYQPEDMVECLVCHKLYVFLGTHLRYAHKEFASMLEYKKHFGLDTKRGKTKGQYRELKRLTNKNIKNLELGKKYWFKKGQKGVGKYTRSQETKDRLRLQGKYIAERYGFKGKKVRNNEII